jgi:hypothetical protein
MVPALTDLVRTRLLLLSSQEVIGEVEERGIPVDLKRRIPIEYYGIILETIVEILQPCCVKNVRSDQQNHAISTVRDFLQLRCV